MVKTLKMVQLEEEARSHFRSMAKALKKLEEEKEKVRERIDNLNNIGVVDSIPYIRTN